MIANDITNTRCLKSAPLLTEHNQIGATRKIRKRQHRLLIVEDNFISQRIISFYLYEWGYKKIDIASTGHKALSLLKKHTYSLIILDIGLPDISGFEICRNIKNSLLNASTPVIAVTAYLNKEICKKTLEFGCASVFCQPIDFILLQKFLTNALGMVS